MTWVVVAWSALILGLTVIQLLQVATKSCYEFSTDDMCFAIEVNGRAAWMFEWLVRGIVVWIVGFIPLAAIWFMTRQQARTCPHCGVNVATGLTACANCGYDFALARNPVSGSTPTSVTDVPASVAPVAAAAASAPQPVAALPPEGWYDDAERAGKKRWWTGTAWGMRDDEHPSRASADAAADVASAEPTPAAGEAPELVAEAPDEAEFAAAPAGSATQAGLGPVAVAASAQPASTAEPTPTTWSPSEPTAGELPQARFCENCGAERRAGARFCSSCGHAH